MRYQPEIEVKTLKRTSLIRKTPIKRMNRGRRKKKFARNFGTRAEAVRDMKCLVPGCRGRSEAAHMNGARGMGGCGGDRRGLGPLCRLHHLQSGEKGTSMRADFEAKYGIDLIQESDRIATYLDDMGHE